MVESDEELKEKFMEYVNSKSSKVNNSFTITNEKRDRVIRCLKNPQSEPSSKFRFWVRQKKFRLIQSEDGEGDIVGIPVDEKDGDEVSNVRNIKAVMYIRFCVFLLFIVHFFSSFWSAIFIMLLDSQMGVATYKT